MVYSGKRPEHRRGTTGRPYRRYRKGIISGATHCGRCQKMFVTDASCEHPSHARLKGCPTHPRYPTVEHRDALIDGGHPRDPDALAWCFECNTKAGAYIRDRRRRTPLRW